MTPELSHCLVVSPIAIGVTLAALWRRTRRPARLPRHWTAARRARFYGP